MIDLNLLALGLFSAIDITCSSSSSSLLVLVSDTIKVDKEEEVRAEKSTAKQSRSFSTSTAADIGKMGPVSVSKVGVSAKVNSEQINDELGDLHGCQVTLPPDLGTSSSAEVVVIHKDMHSQVKSNRNPRLL